MLVEVGAYIGYFASEMITENIRKLARRVGSRKRTSLTRTKPITDTEKLFAGGPIGYLSKGKKSGLGFMDNSSSKAFCGKVYLFVKT